MRVYMCFYTRRRLRCGGENGILKKKQVPQESSKSLRFVKASGVWAFARQITIIFVTDALCKAHVALGRLKHVTSDHINGFVDTGHPKRHLR